MRAVNNIYFNWSRVQFLINETLFCKKRQIFWHMRRCFFPNRHILITIIFKVVCHVSFAHRIIHIFYRDKEAIFGQLWPFSHLCPPTLHLWYEIKKQYEFILCKHVGGRLYADIFYQQITKPKIQIFGLIFQWILKKKWKFENSIILI